MRHLLPALLVLCVGCATTNASTVPDVDRSAAITLVRGDLQTLLERPTVVHWERAYRHFDRHLEPHLSSSDRLELEIRFASARRHLKMGEKSRPALRAQIERLLADLQPQD